MIHFLRVELDLKPSFWGIVPRKIDMNKPLAGYRKSFYIRWAWLNMFIAY